MLVGNMYDLNFTVNNEEKINIQTLFSNYPDYTRQEEIYKLNLNPINVEWQKFSPTRYHVKINNTIQSQNGYFLVFLTTYDPNWKAYITKEGETSQIPEEQHIKVFEYASAWYINQTGQLEIVIEYEPQKWFYYGSLISIATLTACTAYLTYTHTKNKNIPHKIKQKLKYLLAGNQK